MQKLISLFAILFMMASLAAQPQVTVVSQVKGPAVTVKPAIPPVKPSATQVPPGWEVKDGSGNRAKNGGAKGNIAISYDKGKVGKVHIDKKNKCIEVTGTFHHVGGNAVNAVITYGGKNFFTTNPSGGKGTAWAIHGDGQYFLTIDDGGTYVVQGSNVTIYVDGNKAKGCTITCYGGVIKNQNGQTTGYKPGSGTIHYTGSFRPASLGTYGLYQTKPGRPTPKR